MKMENEAFQVFYWNLFYQAQILKLGGVNRVEH